MNSNSISFVSKDAALLDLMNVMFKINQGENAKIKEFRLQNFFACYRPFLRATLPYECLSMSLRVNLYENIYKQLDQSEVPGSTLVAGAVSGMAG